MFVIVTWYYAQIAAQLLLNWNSARLAYWFTTNTTMTLTPGMVLALISHAFLPNIGHILGNLLGLAIVGGASERHMSPKEFLGFFVVIGYSSIHLSTFFTPNGTFGASGAIFGYVGFYSIHMLCRHRERLAFQKYDWEILPTDKQTRRYYKGMLVLLVPPMLFVFFSGQLYGVFSAGRSDVFGHLVGLVLGILWALWRGWAD